MKNTLIRCSYIHCYLQKHTEHPPYCCCTYFYITYNLFVFRLFLLCTFLVIFVFFALLENKIHWQESNVWRSKEKNTILPRSLVHSTRSELIFWRRNYFFNFSTPCIKNVNNTWTKYVRIMKQTAFWREKNGEYIPCLKYSVHIFVE